MVPPARWNQLVAEVLGHDTRITDLRFFESKKNQVTLLILQRDGALLKVMAKYFVWGECEREWEILEKAHAAGLEVPRPLARRDNVCFVQFLEGENLRRIGETRPEHLDGAAVGRWLARFHAIFREGERELLKGDCSPPNFIVTRDQVLYGIDFEEARHGNALDEVAEAAVSLLMFKAAAPGLPQPNLAAAQAVIDAWWEYQAPHRLAGRASAGIAERMAECLDMKAHHVPFRADEFHAWARLLRERPHLVG